MSMVANRLIARYPHDGKGHQLECRWVLTLGRECCSCQGGELGAAREEARPEPQRKITMDIAQARTFLRKEAEDRFKDKTFRDYINFELAGDFAVEIATLIQRQQEVERNLCKLLAQHDLHWGAVAAALGGICCGGVDGPVSEPNSTGGTIVAAIKALRGEKLELRIALDSVARVASGERQVADNDTEAMAWIQRFIADAVQS